MVGIGVSVGGTRVLVGGRGVSVGAAVFVGGRGVSVGAAVFVGEAGAFVGVAVFARCAARCAVGEDSKIGPGVSVTVGSQVGVRLGVGVNVGFGVADGRNVGAIGELLIIGVGSSGSTIGIVGIGVAGAILFF